MGDADRARTDKARTFQGACRGADRKALLYEEVIALVERMVVERRLAPGDLLPTQAELCEVAGVSRITVTRALAELEREGRVRRHQGVGTFLARPRIISEPARAGSLLGTLSSGASGIRLGTQVLDLASGTPSPDLRQALNLQRNARVWYLHRLRMLDGRAMIVETSAIPVKLAPGWTSTAESSLARSTSSWSVILACAISSEEQYMKVASPTDEQRRLLHLSAQSRVVSIRGLSIEASGSPFRLLRTGLPGDRLCLLPLRRYLTTAARQLAGQRLECLGSVGRAGEPGPQVRIG